MKPWEFTIHDRGEFWSNPRTRFTWELYSGGGRFMAQSEIGFPTRQACRAHIKNFVQRVPHANVKE